MHLTSSDRWVFLRSLLRDPRSVGALSPSSSRLSCLIASRVDSCCNSTILEIGAGTGSITYALLNRGIDPKRLILVEKDPALASYLRERFPRVRVKCADALHTSSILSSEAIGKVDTIVSSLPIRNFGPREQFTTVRAMLNALSSNGQLIQYTYAAGCPIPIRRLGLHAECLGRVWMNLPPAAVWRFTSASHESFHRSQPHFEEASRHFASFAGR